MMFAHFRLWIMKIKHSLLNESGLFKNSYADFFWTRSLILKENIIVMGQCCSCNPLLDL